MWCKELLRWVRKLNFEVQQWLHCDDNWGKTSDHYVAVQVLRSISWNSFVQNLRLQTTTHGKTSHGRGCFFLRPCMKLVGIFCNSHVADTKLLTNCVTLCYKVMTSIETGSSFNWKLFSWCRTLGWQLSLLEHCVNKLLILIVNWWFVLSQLRETWLERGIEWIHWYNLCLN